MKNLFITLFLIGMSMSVCSQDYYWYKGTKVPLERGCRKYIIYEDDKLSESDKSHITYSEDVFYDEIPDLKWGTTSAHAVINDTAHVHYSTISYRKGGDYYDNLFITHRFYVKLKNQEDLPLLQELAAQNNVEIEESDALLAWHILRCKLDAPKNALELANLFYETTDLFSAAEPEMINTILSEWPKTIKSLCDEWNVLEYRYNSYWGGQDEFHTLHYTQKTDTFITNQRYAKLYKENNYLGALREGNNADIYYIPSDSTHEYLLYAFNAHVGDTLKNVWFGFQDKNHLPFQNVIVKEIQTTNPRTFVLDVERKFINDEIVHGELKWLEGIGFLSSPDGGFFDPLAGGFCYNVLCAYMEGEQVYTSGMGQKYGCYYDGNVPQTDTIPLFIKDGPGSSTVEPVDPNQVVATLQGDQLTIHENSGEDITYSLQNTSSQQAPAQHRAPQSDTFRNEVTVQITEFGEYLLQLTNPSWGYAIVGRFNYVAEGIEMTNDQLQVTNKVIMEGQLFIRRGKKVYTITGQQIQ